MRRSGWLAFSVVAGLAACAAVSAWAIVVALGRANYADHAMAEPGPPGTPASWDHRLLVAGQLSLAALLVTAALFITWHYRLLRRMERILSDPLRHSPGWAISGWFVPFLNFVRPKQMINDTWRATAPPAGPLRRVPLYFAVWWAFWVLSLIVTGVSGRLPLTTDHDIAEASRVTAVSYALTLAAALVAIPVVLSLDRRASLIPDPIPVAAMPGMMLFNPPPGWPEQPPGWQPPPDWHPDPSWPPAPAGWTFWVPRHERWLARLDAPADPQNRGGSK